MHNLAEKFLTADRQKIPHTPFLERSIPVEVEDGILKSFTFVAPSVTTKAYVQVKKTKTGEAVKMTAAQFAAILALVESGDGEKEYDVDTVERFVEGVASSCSLDYEMERMSASCLQSMKTSAANTRIPLKNAHSHEWDAEMGALYEIWIEGSTEQDMLVHTKFKLNPLDKDPIASKLWFMLTEEGRQIGLSIGGVVNKYHTEYSETAFGEIIVYDDIRLLEVSVTAMPANPDTFLAAVGKSLVKSLGELKLTSPVNLPGQKHKAAESTVDTKKSVDSVEELCKALGQGQISMAEKIFHDIISLDEDKKSQLVELIKSSNLTAMHIDQEKVAPEAATPAATEATPETTEATVTPAEETTAEEAATTPVVEEAAVTEVVTEEATVEEPVVETPAEETPTEEPAATTVETEAEKSLIKRADVDVLVKSAVEKATAPLHARISELEKSIPVYAKSNTVAVETEKSMESASSILKGGKIAGCDLNALVKTGRRWFSPEVEYTKDEARKTMDAADPYRSHTAARKEVIQAFGA